VPRVFLLPLPLEVEFSLAYVGCCLVQVSAAYVTATGDQPCVLGLATAASPRRFLSWGDDAHTSFPQSVVLRRNASL